MKYSKYNIIFNYTKNNYILVNTFTGATYKIDEKLKKTISENNIEKLSEPIISDYIKNGIIINDEVDELQVLIYRQNFSKMNSNTLSLTILLTEDCNLRCPYCFEGTDKKIVYLSDEKRVAIFNFIKKMFELDKNLNGLSLVLFGGEPMLNFSENFEFLLNIKKLCMDNDKSFVTSIVTNGTLINEKYLDFLKSINCKKIQITLDGDKNEHDKKRVCSNNKGTFDIIIENIKKVIKYEGLPSPVIRVNIDKENNENIPNLIKYLYENDMNCCSVDFGIIRDTNNVMSDSSNCFKESEIGQILLNLWNELDKYKFNYSKNPIKRSIYCGLQSNKAFTITPNADVYKCWEMTNDEKFRVGQIDNEGKLINIGNHLFEWMNRGIETIDDCKICKFLPLCGCGCTSVSYNKNKNIFTKGCAKTKSILREQLIKNYYERV